MSASRAVHVLVFDGYADWEPGHALAELRRSGKRTVRSVGFSRASVRSMGGLQVIPDCELRVVSTDDVELLILPGGDLWEESRYPRAELETLLASLIGTGVPVAAICGATLALARAGVLNDRRHTSNERRFLLENSSEYRGAAHYSEEPAVRDQHVITASGLAPVDFARAIFRELNMFSPSDEALWFEMFRYARLPEPTL